MKVTQEKLPASQVGLEIEIPPEMSKQAYEKTLQEFTRAANIPGFRKGKVPRQVLVQRFGSSRLKSAAIEELIENSLKQAIEQEKIEAIGNFQLRSSFEELVSQFEPGSALTFSAVVDVPPEVTLNQYKGLQIKAEEVTYDPEQVDQVLENRRNQSATLVPVDGRAAQTGDVAVVDFKGRLTGEDIESESAEIPGGSAEDFQIELVEGKFIAGFVDGIIGMSLEETKDVSVGFPEDYPQQDLAGKAAVFTITLKELKEKELPELDDDFAQDVSEFETLAEWRESLESRFQKEAEQKTKSNKEQALLDELVKHVEVEIPETLTKQEVDYMITQTAMQLSNQGLDIKRLMTKELIPQLRERSRPEAIARIQRTLALGEVAKRESIKVEEAEIVAKVDEILEQYADQTQDIDMDRLRQSVEDDLLREKILLWLEENATVELVPEGSLTPPETLEADADADTLETAQTSLESGAEASDEPSEAAPSSQSTVDTTAEVVTDEAEEVATDTDAEGVEDKAEDGGAAGKAGKASKAKSK
jgi:trigger factor